METKAKSVAQQIGNFTPSSDFARCLAPMLDALGWRGSHKNIIESLPPEPNCIQQDDFLNTMANLKFECKTFKSKLSQVDQRVFPCLSILDDGSAKVLIKEDSEGILAFDGETGTYRLLRIEDQKGVFFLFGSLKSKILDLIKPQKFWFSRLLSRFNKVFFIGAIITFILSIIALITPLFVRTIYDQVLAMESYHTLIYLGTGIVLFIICDVGFRFFRAYLFGFISVRLSNLVGIEILRRILYLPPNFTENASMSSQVSRIKDFESVKDFFGGSALTALFDLPFTLILMGGMAALGGVIVFVPITAIGLFIIMGVITTPFVKRINEAVAVSASKKQDLLVEILNNFRAIKHSGATSTFLNRYQASSADASYSAYTSSKVVALINTFSQTLVTAAGISTMTVGVFGVLSGRMSMGALMASMLLVWRVLAPLRSGFSVLTQINRIKKSLLQINKLMTFKLENRLETSMNLSRGVKGKVDFQQVSIRYNQDSPPALLGLNFNVNIGETVVITGHGGSGKSTIFKLILGMYHPQAGRILIDDMNVRQIDPISLRQSITYTPQRNPLFYGTIEQNLRLANPIASIEEIKEAARCVGILDEVEKLENGFNFVIGSHNYDHLPTSLIKGINLSRIFLKKANILLLDTPDVGLTATQENTFIENLTTKKNEQTVFIITQNQKYLQFADKIIWLDKGRLKMAGPKDKVLPHFITAQFSRTYDMQV